MSTNFYRYKYVKEYDKNKIVNEEDINHALETAWQCTPSKNNFMPYKVHVLGPDRIKEKELIYWKCLSNETKANGNHITSLDHLKEYEKEKYSNNPPSFKNVIDAQYLLIFTQRVEKNPNPFQQHLINQGHSYEQTATEGPKKEKAKKVAYIEIGMFSQMFTDICLGKGIDISHTLCFPGDLLEWTELEFEFLDEPPLLIVTAGIGKVFRNHDLYLHDRKPDYNKIVNILHRNNKDEFAR
jgi:hypothetical protein